MKTQYCYWLVLPNTDREMHKNDRMLKVEASDPNNPKNKNIQITPINGDLVVWEDHACCDDKKRVHVTAAADDPKNLSLWIIEHLYPEWSIRKIYVEGENDKSNN